jgi:diaminopimelate epimerase
MKKVFFTKMSGAGNDFVLIDKDQNKGFSPGKKNVTSICDRRNGIGADGLITISKDKNHDFLMEYYNADGSTGSLCGNGARCAIKFAKTNGLLKNGTAKFLSNKKEYSGKLLKNNLVKFNLNEPKKIKENFVIEIDNFKIKASYVDTGSPHAVIFVEDIFTGNKKAFDNIDDIPVFDLGRKLRYSKYFRPKGANINFVDLKKDNIYIRTYERGVEDETLACGTGNAAAALICNLVKKINPPITLITKGKDKLIVDFDTLKGKFVNLSLTGPAKIVFDGEFSFNNLL